MQFCFVFLVLNVIAIRANKPHSNSTSRAAGRRQVKLDPRKLADCVQKFQRNKAAEQYDAATVTLLCGRILTWQTVAADTKGKGGFHKPKLTEKQQGYFGNLERKAKDRKAKNRRNKRQTDPLRKEYRIMTDAERDNYHKCVNGLKTTQIDGVSQFAIIAEYHQPEISPGAHGGHSFCPWHREYLYVFETACQEHVPGVTLPYWDSRLDQPLPRKSDSIIWSDAFMGTAQGDVTSGPFANSEAPTDTGAGCLPNRLCRQLSFCRSRLYDESIFDYVKSITHFTALSSCEDPFFEGVHGGAHVCIGGQMDAIETASFDPIFYLHHCFIDYLFELFRQTVQTREQREEDYPATCDCSSQCNPEDDALPFDGKVNIDGLSNDYTDSYYQYDKHPVCNAARTDCDPPSKYLFCHRSSRRCISKVKIGGSCSGFSNTPICYQGTCSGGRCVRSGGGGGRPGGSAVDTILG